MNEPENKKNECRGSVKIKKLLNTPIMALGRGNLHPLNKDMNKSLIKKKLSQNKKKKKGKKEEKCEEKDNNKKRKNKKIKKNKKERLSQKKIKSDLLKEENDKILKERDNITNVIFFDYSSSIENKEESDDSINNVSININDNKSFIHNELTPVNNKDNKAEDDTNDKIFRKQKTAVIDHKSYESNKKKDLLQEKKILKPKTKQSCHMDSSNHMNMNLFFQMSNHKLTKYNLALENTARIKPRSKPISSNNLNKDKKNNEKEKDKKDSNNIIKLFNPKIIFNRKIDGEKQNKVPPRHSFWKSINRSTEKYFRWVSKRI